MRPSLHTSLPGRRDAQICRPSPQLLPQGLKGLRVGRATHEAIKGGPGGGPGGPSGSIRVLPLQEFVHHVCVHRAEHAVPEGSGQRAHDGETELPVQLDGRRIGAYDVVELHGQVTITPGPGKTVQDHRTPDTPALGGWPHQVGGAGNVRPEAWVVGAVPVHAQDIRTFRGKIGRLRAEPVGLECRPIEVGGERQRITAGDDFLEDLLHRCKIGWDCRSDFHGGRHPWAWRGWHAHTEHPLSVDGEPSS